MELGSLRWNGSGDLLERSEALRCALHFDVAQAALRPLG
jgi:hypothetical protein